MFKNLSEKQNPYFGVLISYVSKGISFVLSFISIPLLLNNLELSQYSLWITLVSIVNWINLLDLGVGNGLKNTIAKYNHLRDKKECAYYITGTFQFFSLISGFLVILTLIFSKYIPVIKINIGYSFLLYLPIICFFPFTTFNAVLQGNLKNGLLSIISLVRALWIFFAVLLFKYTSSDKIIICAICYNIFNILYFIFILFSIKKIYLFSLSQIFNFKLFVFGLKIVRIGLEYFILQVTSLIQFSMGNYIIYNLFNNQVASFDLLNNKIYANLAIFFNAGIAVFWPQFTSAMASHDAEKLIKYRSQLLIMLIVYIFGLGISIPIITPFVGWWTQGKILVNIKDIIPFVLFNIVLSINYYEAVILNAAEKINIQILFSLMTSILFITLVSFSKYFLIKSYIIIPIINTLILIPSFFIYKIHADRIVNSFRSE
ncbi:lipopolysaccharide biosynthesis protein [Treponema primitia]|uniref:lipopolysaccharide biosynthesis protein n=1 Tax=Treponema primitia TaxID=88058 RepID=UPI0002555600|nr:hypothetical protein [Treponema primitia]